MPQPQPGLGSRSTSAEPDPDLDPEDSEGEDEENNREGHGRIVVAWDQMNRQNKRKSGKVSQAFNRLRHIWGPQEG